MREKPVLAASLPSYRNFSCPLIRLASNAHVSSRALLAGTHACVCPVLRTQGKAERGGVSRCLALGAFMSPQERSCILVGRVDKQRRRRTTRCNATRPEVP